LEQSYSEFGEVTEISELLWFLPFYDCATAQDYADLMMEVDV
jgi:hypothetical protein